MKVSVIPLLLHILTFFLIDVQADERLKAHEIIAIAKQTWHKMSYDEQKAATVSTFEELNDEREVKVLAKRNVPLSAFHDIKKTLEGIENQASLSFALFSSESSNKSSRFWLCIHEHLLRLSSLPFAATRIIITLHMSLYPVLGSPNFLTLVFVKLCQISFFVSRLFVYLVFRVNVYSDCLYYVSNLLIFSIGVAKNYVQTTLDMKKNLSIMILDKLREFGYYF
jgi:hypothetical protein